MVTWAAIHDTSGINPLMGTMKHALIIYMLMLNPVPLRSFRPRSNSVRKERPSLVQKPYRFTICSSRTARGTKKDEEDTMEYRNPITSFLSGFMESGTISSTTNTIAKGNDPLSAIDFAAPKIAATLDLERLASILDAELYNREWFVTGNVNPIYFSDDFVFQDPDVRLEGIEAYARGVNRLFDQESSRAEIISTEVNSTIPDTITCTWRLSGKAKIGPGLTIKPYIVRTDFRVDPTTRLIVFQEDHFDIPQWDILLSSLFPFLIGKITAPPAPPVPPRMVQIQAGGGKL